MMLPVIMMSISFSINHFCVLSFIFMLQSLIGFWTEHSKLVLSPDK